jgi:hypothetical protein
MKKKKIRLPITIKLWHKGKLIHRSTCTKKTQILIRTRREKWDKAYIKVTYKKDYWNDCDSFNQCGLEKALNAYLEEKMVQHALGGPDEL